MIDAPQQDWSLYERLVANADAVWHRNRTPAERFALYADMFRIVLTSNIADRDWPRLDAWRWREKLASRVRMVDSLKKLDQLRRERSTSSNVG